jgi:hypothetical protein
MLAHHPALESQVKALCRIDGVDVLRALSWALEAATPERFPSIKQAMSSCGLTSALRDSAGQLAPMYNEKLKEVHRKALEKGGHRNRATLAVAAQAGGLSAGGRSRLLRKSAGEWRRCRICSPERFRRSLSVRFFRHADLSKWDKTVLQRAKRRRALDHKRSVMAQLIPDKVTM